MTNGLVAEDVRRIVEQLDLGRALGGSTVLVSGAGGFLAGYMVETLLAAGESGGDPIRVIGLVRDMEAARRRYATHLDRPDLELVVQDVNQPMGEAFTADHVIHAASPASPRQFGADPVGTILPNVVGTQALLDLAVASKSRSFLFLSTSEVYGRVESIPTSETDFGPLDPTDPRACYAESKRAGEAMCIAWHRQLGVPAKIARPFHVYGPGMPLNDGRVFSDFVGDVIANRSVHMKSEGTATRSFCYVADATAAFFTILIDGTPGVAYNVGDPSSELSVRDLARLLIRLRSDKGPEVDLHPRDASDTYMPSPIERSAPDIARLMALGWRPRVAPAEGFERTIASFEETDGR